MKQLLYGAIIFLLCFGTTFNYAVDIRRPTMPRKSEDQSQDLGVRMPKTRKPEAPRNIRKKRKGLQVVKKRYTFTDMNLAELTEAKDRAVKSKNYLVACKYLERMNVLSDDINEKAAISLELADLYFEQGSIDEAAKWYADFANRYPGNKKVEYALYREMCCYYQRILDIDRDQSPTELALEKAQELLKRSDLTVAHKTEAKKVKKECQQQLAASDMSVVEFFIASKEYQQAEKRLATIRSDWQETVPEVLPEVAKLEIALADQYSEYTAPESSIKLVQATTPKPMSKKVDMTTRF